MAPFTQSEVIVLFTVLVAAVGAGLVRGYAYMQFVAYVKAKHPEVWTALGRPGLPEGPLAHRRLRPWLIRRQYRTLNDERVNQLASRWWMLQLFQLFVVLGAIAAITHVVGVW